MTLENLIERTNYSLSKAGLTLSDTGVSEMSKRWNKKEDEGGFSQEIKEADYVSTCDKSFLQVWRGIQEAKSR